MFAPGDEVALAGGDAHKLLHVLRASNGDAVEICDSGGRAFAATVRIEGDRARARLDEELASPRPLAVELTLAQGIPKGAKMDYVVEKATELGVVRIVPFASERTIGDAERAGKLERWRRLAKTAAQQCGRRDVPLVEPPRSWAALVASLSEVDVALVPWELAERRALRETLPPLVADARRVLVAIGPEGGLTHAEAEHARAAGAHLVSLGERILRTETAGLVACSAVLYAMGEL